MFRVVVMTDGESGYLAEAQPLTPLADGQTQIEVYEWRGSANDLDKLIQLWGLRDTDVANDGSGLERMTTQLNQTGSFTIAGSYETGELQTHGFTRR